jgi:hypothetical protein
MNRFGVILTVVLMQAVYSLAEAPYSVAWTRQMGSALEGTSETRIAADAFGNIYISGSTEGSLGGPNLGIVDNFLIKYDSSGVPLWSRQIGTTRVDGGCGVAVDASGNSYIGGSTSGSLGGANAGGFDAFISKHDPLGNVLWSKQLGTSGNDWCNSIAVDSAGNSYISGYTEGSGLGGTNKGRQDAFLTKYDTTGTLLWCRQIATSAIDEAFGVALDASGNAYVTGMTMGNIGGTPMGSYDAFLTKYDASGSLLWSRKIGTSSWDQAYSVAVDISGNAYIGGLTYGNLGGTNSGLVDVLLAKYDASGTALWTKQFGTSGSDQGTSVAVDLLGNAYISGYTDGSLGASNVGGNDLFLFKYDSSGNIVWSTQTGTAGGDAPWSVALDTVGSVYICGGTSGNFGGPNVGSGDVFLMKFEAPEPATLSLMTLGGCVILRRKNK